jgi:hypothetical protein
MKKNHAVLSLLVVVIVIIAIIAGTYNREKYKPDDDGEFEQPFQGIPLEFEAPYAFNKQGYEPSISADSTGALYYTAHKNLDDKSSWDYPASWFFISTDEGRTWKSPDEPFPSGRYWQTFLGDEGDIGVDAQDNVYYVDTYLLDNHIHVFADQGQWQYSVRIQKTTGLDDRPWITAQGNYRSTNGARTFTAGEPVPGNGWGHIDAERNGNHVYIISESNVGGEADILMYISSDQGQTWDWNHPVKIAHRNGSGRQYPIVSAQENGVVWALWNDATNAAESGNVVFVGRSTDYGQTWDTWNITPFRSFMDYPTINAGPDGSVAVAFYATTTLPVSTESEWYLYGAMQLNATEGNLTLNFTIADPTPCYVGDNTHALHDFFEIVITPDFALNIGYQYYIGPENGHSDMYFVRGTLADTNVGKNGME